MDDAAVDDEAAPGSDAVLDISDNSRRKHRASSNITTSSEFDESGRRSSSQASIGDAEDIASVIEPVEERVVPAVSVRSPQVPLPLGPIASAVPSDDLMGGVVGLSASVGITKNLARNTNTITPSAWVDVSRP